jgi:FkbM family methyltransferase
MTQFGMSQISSKINKALSTVLGYDPVSKFKIHKISSLVSIGTEYGGWAIPDKLLSEKSVCYLAGAGEDISFDTGIAERYGCEVHIFDPTPRARKHFEVLQSAVAEGRRQAVNNSTVYYTIGKDRWPLLHYHELGLWESEEVLKFYAPRKAEHASYSALNIQKTEDYIEAKADRLSSVMKKLGHKSIDLLKLDIEGAEYKVLQSILEDNLDIGVICVEFDEAHFSLDEQFVSRIRGSLQALNAHGYLIIDCNEHCNYTLCRKDLLSQL